jgi:DNA replication protein DnaC
MSRQPKINKMAKPTPKAPARASRNPTTTTPTIPKPTVPPSPRELRDRILAHLGVLRVPITAGQLDAVLSAAEQESWSHLQFLERLVGQQADQRRERAIERRIRNARFPDPYTLETFDWEFNAKTIDRSRIENLATCEFIGRGSNLLFVGQSGVGKSHLIQALGRRGCVLGYRVRYTTSSELLLELTASLADHTLPKRLREYNRYQWLIIDEFGFDKLERNAAPETPSLLFKIIASRRGRSTTIVTNIEFETWETRLGDPQLTMGLLDRLVDGAIILKLQGRSYRAHRAQANNSPAARPT